LKVEAMREIRSLPVEHGDPKIIVVLELVIGLAQGVEGRDIDTVLRIRAIDTNEEHAIGQTAEADGALALRLNQRRPVRRRRLGERRVSGGESGGGRPKQSENLAAGHACLRFAGSCHCDCSSKLC